MKRPRLNALRTFAAAGRRLSFSAAAADLDISQAAVSQQIRQLESYLDTALFIRHNRRLSLTSKGQAYLDAVHEALERLDTVTDQLFPGLDYQTVTLRCTASVAALWVAPRVRELHRAHPEIELRIVTLDSNLDHDRASAADLEIVVAGDEGSAHVPGHLLRATIVPVCAPQLLQKQARPKVAADLLNFELIHVLGYEHDWHRWFRHYAADDVRPPRGLAVDGSMIAIEAAVRGDGAMLGRRPFIDRHLRSGSLVEVFGDSLHLNVDYHLRTLGSGAARPATRKVKRWLESLNKAHGTEPGN